MSDSKDHHDLSDLTVKDLRLLAVEHDIPNRSRLAREDLISALSSVIAARAESAPAAAPAAAVKKAVAQVVAQAEPEVIDPASIAGFALPAAPHAAADEEDEDDDEDDDDSDDTDDSEGSSSGEPEVLDPAAVQGEGGRRRRRRRRRRRGPRTGEAGAADGTLGAASPTADAQNGEASAADAESDPTAAKPTASAPMIDASARAPRPERTQRPDDRRPDVPRGDNTRGESPRGENPRGENPRGETPRGEQQRGDSVRGEASRSDSSRGERRPDDRRGVAGPTANGNGAAAVADRQSRPRLEGPQRSVPSVLERLRSFTAGILDLCDPSTPSWAQPRMSELLAEAGLAPIPATGQPHPDFHEVVGSVVAAPGIENGHIAVIEAPGFALRGDRGDLFPLRKAKVRIVGALKPSAREQQPSEGEPRRSPAPAVRADDAVESRETAAVSRVETAPSARQAPPRAASPARGMPAAAAPVTKPDIDDDAALPVPKPLDITAAPRPPRPQPPVVLDPVDELPNNPGAASAEAAPDAGFSQPAPVPMTAAGKPMTKTSSAVPSEASAASAGSAESAAPVRSDRGDGRRARGGRNPGHALPADMAPSLPLAMQDADELASLPKAEGFRALGLNEQILADLAAMGFNNPTGIQEESIPAVIKGVDLVGQAQTGTGKTAAFVLPILQALYQAEGDGPVALVLSPTRELARQIHEAFIKMAGASGARAALIYGGVSMDDQFDALDRKPHVVIGTPGRIIDHVKRKTLDLSRLRIAVLDEADQMLDIGFWPDVTWIISHTPPSRQTLLFSATFPDPIRILAEKHMRDPQHIRIQSTQVTVDQVDQKYIAVDHDKKTGLLAHFIETQNPEQLVVFCRTKHQTDRVAEVLKRKGKSAGAIHGDLPQTKRERMLKEFREGSLQCLIATNVAARGLDIPSVSHVVNYDIPEQPEEYVHRIGRTARNGAKGVARTFITPEDGQFLIEIEKHIGMELTEEPVEGFTTHKPKAEPTRPIAQMQVGTPRLLKPLVGGIRLGRRR